MADGLLVDGSDIQSAGARIIQVWDDPLDTPQKRGSNITIPYADGELYVPKKPLAARDYSVGMLIVGADLEGLYAELDALNALLPDLTGDDTTCTLTEQCAGRADVTALAEYTGGLSPSMQNYRMAKLTLRFRILGGIFT
ncbi:MAG TPA: hypothetical protein VG899_12445 [Mycobacteriales bacterium]|nr:hypothetical protein [Mycobacteriales bacterium]